MEATTKNPSFSPFSFVKNGLLYDYSENQYPTRLHSWEGSPVMPETFFLDEESSCYYVFLYKGNATLHSPGRADINMVPGMYACVNGSPEAYITGGAGIVIEKIHYAGMFSVGGPIEDWGRLKYIDGCTDSLLVPPVKLGDPCLNALFFPPNINQTQHTHPSMRVGIVLSGSGECITPWNTIPLFPGQIFIIHEETEEVEHEGKKALAGTHSFRTFSREGMVVIAYHPDSDYGPQDEEHPMLNRTIVNGVSAKYLNDIRTQ